MLPTLKRIAVLLLLLAMLQPLLSFKTESSTLYPAKVIEHSPVHSGPGKKYKKVGYLNKGDKIVLYKKGKKGWTEIRYKGKRAFIYTKHFKALAVKTAKKANVKAANPIVPSPPAIVEPTPFSFISHRGASGLFPEHTFAAYDEAIQLKTDYIEIDLRVTKDGQFIALHDETVDRTTNGTGKPGDYMLEEIQQLDAGIRFYNKPTLYKVLSLAEIFQKYGNNVNYYIETRPIDGSITYDKDLLNLISLYKINTENIIFESFSLQSLQNLSSLDKSLKLVQLFNVSDPQEVLTNIDWISTHGYGVGVNNAIINDSFVKIIKSKHLELHVWTVDKEEDMKKLIDLGVTGIFTDYPNILQKVLIQKGMR